MKTNYRSLNKTIVAKAGYCFCLFSVLFSCEDFVTIDPPKNQIVSATVFNDDATAFSAIRGIYSEMLTLPGFSSGTQSSITSLTGLSSDELAGYTPSLLTFENNTLIPTNSDIKSSLWDTAYKLIYYTNSMIEGLNGSTNISLSTKKQLQGEAKFVRAFCYFYLVNLFGDVPLATTTDFRINNVLPRSAEDQVYQLIIQDLKDAEESLGEDYSSFSYERVRPNKYSATAFLSRVLLFRKEWSDAELKASVLINNSSLYSLVTDLNDVFKMNSNEAIWQLRPVNPSKNTNEAEAFVLTSPNFNTPTISVNQSLLDAFEPGDQRKDNWLGSITSDITGVTYYYPFKYKIYQSSAPLTEYYMMFRLAEQYLIRAEARAQQDKLTEAISDVDVIRSRSGLPLIEDTNPSISKGDLLLLIEHEKRIEFFAEWGHRWFDLKRTERADVVLKQLKDDYWQPSDKLYPIPQPDRQNNPNLSQNSGY